MRLIFVGLVVCAALGGCRPKAPLTLREYQGKTFWAQATSRTAYEHALRGEIAAQRGRFAAARAAFAEAIDEDGSSPFLHVRMAEIDWTMGQRRSAQRHLRRAFELNPKFPEALTFAGQIALAKHDSEK